MEGADAERSKPPPKSPIAAHGANVAVFAFPLKLYFAFWVNSETIEYNKVSVDLRMQDCLMRRSSFLYLDAVVMRSTASSTV